MDGKIAANFGYYVSMKYRFSEKTSTVLPFNDGGVVTTKTLNNDGVSGAQYMIGLSYKFLFNQKGIW